MEYRPVPLAFEPRSVGDALAASQSFLDSMRGRRSVRHFSTEPVPWELVENAIRTAGTAPSGAHQQPWTFVAVTDPEVKQQMRTAAEDEELRLYKERASKEYLEAIEPIGTDWIKAHITDAPVVIVVFEQAYGLEPDGGKRKHYYSASRSGSPSASCSRRCTRRGWRR